MAHIKTLHAYHTTPGSDLKHFVLRMEAIPPGAIVAWLAANPNLLPEKLEVSDICVASNGHTHVTLSTEEALPQALGFVEQAATALRGASVD
jgi:hypothetical protein